MKYIYTLLAAYAIFSMNTAAAASMELDLEGQLLNWAEHKEAILLIEGASAERLYHSLEVKTERTRFSSNTKKYGKNISCERVFWSAPSPESNVYYTCEIKINLKNGRAQNTKK